MNWLTDIGTDVGGKCIEERINSINPKYPIIAIVKKNPSSLTWIKVLLGLDTLENDKLTKKQEKLIGKCKFLQKGPGNVYLSLQILINNSFNY